MYIPTEILYQPYMLHPHDSQESCRYSSKQLRPLASQRVYDVPVPYGTYKILHFPPSIQESLYSMERKLRRLIRTKEILIAKLNSAASSHRRAISLS
jgi:hypothetical protein